MLCIMHILDMHLYSWLLISVKNFIIFAATCLRERFDSKRRSMSCWFTFWWFYWILSCPPMFVEKVEKERNSSECVSFQSLISLSST